MKQTDKTPAKKTKSLRIILIVLLAFITILILVAIVSAITSSPEEIEARNKRIKDREQKEQLEKKTKELKVQKAEEERSRKHYSKMDALIQSQVYIENKLKSPGSAKFDSSTDRIIQTNDTTFTVISYVDSQNGYGALLRTHYSCKVIFHSKDDTHNIENAIME